MPSRTPDRAFEVRGDLLVDDDELAPLLMAAPLRRPWPKSDTAIVSQMVRLIVQQCDPVAVLLFGSRARGTAHPDSDVDLLVVLQDVADRMQTILAIRESITDAPMAKDIFVATPEQLRRERHLPWTIVHNALREGCLLYERRGADPEDPELASLRSAGSCSCPPSADGSG